MFQNELRRELESLKKGIAQLEANLEPKLRELQKRREERDHVEALL